jgi:hypothetical protein
MKVFTVPAGFEKLKSDLEITGLQSSIVSTRQKGVRDTMASGLTVLEDFLTGSYARSTMIAPLNVIICLDLCTGYPFVASSAL